MNLLNHYSILIAMCIGLLSGNFCYGQYPAGSPVAINGKLQIVGNKLSNECGNPVQLRGMASHGVQWFSNCYNSSSLDALTKDWKSDIFRISMYIQEGGYANNPSYWKPWIDNIVDECGKRGIYVIIDFHVHIPGDPMEYINDAREFWTYMSKKHAGKKHVLYEICNEPNKVAWSRVKQYANDIIPRIRENDPSTVIICGSSTWSQDVDIAANDPLNYSNIIYSLHFYAGSHYDELRKKANIALAKGLPIIVTEFGTSDAANTRGPLINESEAWMAWMTDNQISWTNWSFTDKNEPSSALLPGSCNGNWNNTSAAGAWIKDKISNPAKQFKCDGIISSPIINSSPYKGTPAIIPGKIEAENYDIGLNGEAYRDYTPGNNNNLNRYRKDGVDLNICQDEGGGYLVGKTQAGEWLKYTVNVTKSDKYDFKVRVASVTTGNLFHVEVDGKNVTGLITVPNTEDWHTWRTVLIPEIELEEGLHVMKVYMDSKGFDLNYIEVTSSSEVTELPFKGSPFVVPGKFEAEDYNIGKSGVAYYDLTPGNNNGLNKYRKDDVDIGICKDLGGGFHIGATRAGEWVNYFINVSSAGNYDIKIRVASITNSSKIHMEIDGKDISGSVPVPNTGDWHTWENVVIPSIDLSAGTKVLKLFMETSGFDVNNIVFEKSGTPVDTSKIINSKPTVNISSPLNNTNYTSPATITLAANATDKDGKITKVEFYNGSVKLGEDLTAPYSYNLTNIASGLYNITAIATDDSSAKTTSGVVVIKINEPEVTNCDVSKNPPAAEWELKNDWNDQYNGSGFSNSSEALTITHRPWGRNKLWVIQSGNQIDLESGKNYTISFDFKNDPNNPVTSLEFGLASGIDGSGPVLNQPSKTISAPLPSSYLNKSVSITPSANGKLSIAIGMNWTGQPNQEVNTFIKNLSVCVNNQSSVRISSDFVNSDNYLASPNPFINEATIEVFSEEKELLNISVSNVSGTIVYSSLSHSTNEPILIGENFSNGVYTVKATYGNRIAVFKLVKMQ